MSSSTIEGLRRELSTCERHRAWLATRRGDRRDESYYLVHDRRVTEVGSDSNMEVLARVRHVSQQALGF